MAVSEGLLRVSAVARQADVPARTVRFYADIGLLGPIARGTNGDRACGFRMRRVRRSLTPSYSMRHTLCVIHYVTQWLPRDDS